MDQVKRLMHMHKLELLGLLQEVTEENERLRANCHQLEEANARLALSNHELSAECDALHDALTELRREREEAGATPEPAPFASTEAAYGLPQLPEAPPEPLPQAQAEPLPLGSFAEAMVAVEQIVAHTQAAADAYLERCRTGTEDCRAQAEEALAQARRQAEAILQQARTQKAALERETREAGNRLRGEMQRLNQFMTTMEPVEKMEGDP